MVRRAGRAAASAPRTLRLRPLVPGDAARLAEIDASSNRPPWTAAQFAEEVRRPGSLSLAAEEDGRPVGFAVAWTVDGSAQIHQLAVDPAHRRRGIASRLLEALLRSARERGCRTAELELRAGNAAARKLYGKAGFREVGLRKRFYEGREDAVLMTLDL